MVEGEKSQSLLRSLRLKQGLQGKEIARKLGVSPSAVSQWEKGKRRPQNLHIKVGLFSLLNPSGGERDNLLDLLGLPRVPEGSDTLDLELLQKRSDRALNLASELTVELADIARLSKSVTIFEDKGRSGGVK